MTFRKIPCDVCGKEMVHGPHKYEGHYNATYQITVCDICHEGNWDGWAPHIEERVTHKLREKNLPLPPRNDKGFLPYIVSEDVRWLQSLDRFSTAFSELQGAVELAGQRELSKLETQGLIKGFEYTYESAWKTLKGRCETDGIKDIQGARDAIRIAFKEGLIENGEVWMDMLKSYHLISHACDGFIAKKIATVILNKYFAEFEALREKMENLKEDSMSLRNTTSK